MISINKLEFHYDEGDFELSIPELTVYQAEKAAVIGPSGSGKTTLLAIILVFALSLRLCEREIQTIFKLGCGRMTIIRLLGAEIIIIVIISCIFCFIFVSIMSLYSNELVRMMFIK